MESEKFKKGDVVCVVDTSRLEYRFVTETKVSSAGKKWVTTEYNGTSNKFCPETLYSEYMGYMLVKGDKNNCLEYIKHHEETKKMIREINRYFDFGKPDYDVVKKMYELIEK